MAHALKTLKSFSSFHQKYFFFRPLCTINKDVSPVISTSSPDLLLQDLKNARNSVIVLRTIDDHYKILNSKHVIQAFRSVFDIQKMGSSEISSKQLIRNPNFEKLCVKLKLHAGVLELDEAIEALKIMSFLGIQSDAHIVNVLLQLIRNNVNSLSIRNIIFLDYLLGQFHSSPLVDALKIAIPLVFDIQLPKKLNKQNLQIMTDCLFFASKSQVSISTIEMLITSLLEYEEQIDVKNAKSIVWSLCDIRTFPLSNNFTVLLSKVLNELIIYIDQMNYEEVESTLTKLIGRYSRRSTEFYDEVFYDSCANYVIEHNLGFKKAIYILRKLARVYHFNKYLIDYASAEALKSEEFLKAPSTVEVYSLVVPLSITEYRPPQWRQLKEVILRAKNLGTVDKKEIIWLKYAAALCVLEIFKIDVLNRALEVNFLEATLKKGFSSDLENYFIIYWSLTNHRPELVDILPTKFDMEFISKTWRPKEFLLERSLETMLGGSNYVVTGVKSKLGLLIDHAIMFSKAGFPVSFEGDVEYIEDIDVKDHNLLLIWSLKPIHYTINTKALKEFTLFAIKVFETNGFNVLPVCLELWENLNEFEKMPYLSQAIKSKLPNQLNLEDIC